MLLCLSAEEEMGIIRALLGRALLLSPGNEPGFVMKPPQDIPENAVLQPLVFWSVSLSLLRHERGALHL